MSNDAHTPAGQDASDIYAEHLARVQYGDLPDNCIRAVKASILDTLACIYAGTSSPDVRETMAAAKNWGGKPTSTLAPPLFHREVETVHTPLSSSCPM